MLEKPKRAKQLNNQDRQLPATIQELINRYDLENKDIYKFLDYLVDNINNKTATGEGSVAGDTLPVGAVIEWNSDIIPENWLLCNGQAVNREEYSELFEILGVAYGKGDGSTTFNIPNYTGRVAIGKDENDADFSTLGKTGGEKTHKLTINEMPKHAHKTWIADNNYSEKGDGYENYYYGSGRNYNLTTYEGGDQAHNNLQPYIITNFIIKAKQSSGLVATVIDSLKSNSPTDGLSAKQGKIMDEKFSKKVLWTNTSQYIEFPPQAIALSSDDYDYLIILVYRNPSQETTLLNLIAEKNLDAEISYGDCFNGEVRNFNRKLSISDNNITFKDCFINGTINNGILIPYKIIGGKY